MIDFVSISRLADGNVRISQHLVLRPQLLLQRQRPRVRQRQPQRQRLLLSSNLIGNLMVPFLGEDIGPSLGVLSQGN